MNLLRRFHRRRLPIFSRNFFFFWRNWWFCFWSLYKSYQHTIAKTNYKKFGKYTFLSCTALQSVDLQSSYRIKKIGKGAFSRCSSLKIVKSPKQMEIIDDWTFRNLYQPLEEIHLPESVTNIGRGKFRVLCEALTLINLQSTCIKTIGDLAFSMVCISLRSFNNEAERTEILGYEDDLLYNTKIPSKRLKKCCKGMPFRRCVELKSVHRFKVDTFWMWYKSFPDEEFSKTKRKWGRGISE